jgi:hypothetical protein
MRGNLDAALELADDFTALTGSQAAPQQSVDVLADESHGTIAEQNVSSADVHAASSEPADAVPVNVRMSGIRAGVGIHCVVVAM